MNFKILFTDSANEDFYNIIDYIAQDSLTNALKFVEQLETRIKDTLSILPFSGTPYKDNIRFFSFGNYVVVYEPQKTDKIVVVYMITQSNRQWRTILDDRA